jgi:hypothetical protein
LSKAPVGGGLGLLERNYQENPLSLYLKTTRVSGSPMAGQKNKKPDNAARHRFAAGA